MGDNGLDRDQGTDWIICSAHTAEVNMICQAQKQYHTDGQRHFLLCLVIHCCHCFILPFAFAYNTSSMVTAMSFCKQMRKIVLQYEKWDEPCSEFHE
jgi:hypothetical protein